MSPITLEQVKEFWDSLRPDYSEPDVWIVTKPVYEAWMKRLEIPHASED